MRKTLLLCFIHGFKGDDNTFGDFPEHLRALISHDLPKVNVRAIVYPKFETRGDLAECVSRFRDWLLEKVIDIEVEANTPSPTVDPSVHTILIGHSMGGIVAADTLLSLATDKAVPQSSNTADSPASPTRPGSSSSKDPRIAVSTPPVSPTNQPINSLMFPYIHGVLAFDTPYLGISPGVVAHGAEGHYNTANEYLNQLGGLSAISSYMGWGPTGDSNTATPEVKEANKQGNPKAPVAALPAPPQSSASTPAWQKWGKIAMYAGAAGAVAAGSAAAYLKRETISTSWSWAYSHLEFVGCLLKGADLQKRLAGVQRCHDELGTGFANLYTRLGRGAQSTDGKGTWIGAAIGHTRTFCNLPREKGTFGREWAEAVNEKASDEIWAHMYMFQPKENPGYEDLKEKAKGEVVGWVQGGEWYAGSEDDGGETHGALGG